MSKPLGLFCAFRHPGADENPEKTAAQNQLHIHWALDGLRGGGSGERFRSDPHG